MIKALLFDLGNVLVRVDTERAFRQIADVTGFSRRAIIDMLIGGRLHDRYEIGAISTDDFYAEFSKRSSKQFSRAELLDAASDIFTEMKEMTELVGRAKRMGYRLVVVSNTNEAHVEFVRKRWRFLEDFDQLVLSFQIGAVKPQRQFYEAALQAAGCAAQECLFVDDLAPNIAGATEFGFNTLLFKDPALFKSEAESLGIRFGD
jgi:glucose-1-phosphatase